jgi:hypothetical protein
VGFSIDPAKRLENMSANSPLPLRILASYAGTRKDEAALHRKLKAFRKRTEWFGPEVVPLVAEYFA